MGYLRQAELKHRPSPTYMSKQLDIDDSMRTILVDWLVEVADEFGLSPQTLFAAVNHTDRFLSTMSVRRTKLQLIGITSILLASKYEEVYPPRMVDFYTIADRAYRMDQILKMEHVILRELRFDMGCVTVASFLDRFLGETFPAFYL